jgi:hypothetical protein
VQQYEPAVQDLRELFDVLDDCPVARRAVQGHKNGLVDARPFLRIPFIRL